MDRPDFTSQEFFSWPELTFSQLRNRGQGDIVKVKLPIMGRVWLTLSSQACTEMLKDNNRFTMRKPGKHGRKGQVAGVQWWMPRSLRILAQNMLSHDEPDHSRLRSLVDNTFHRSSIIQLENRIATICDDLLDGNLELPTFDLVTTYARPLPLLVICELLGLKGQPAQEFSKHAAKLTGINSIWGMVRLFPALNAMIKMLETEIEHERQKGHIEQSGSGLIGQLVQAQSKGSDISNDEVLAMVFLLLIAGHETTTHAISGSVLTLFENPEHLQRYREDPECRSAAIEELLRFVSPVQFSKPRIVRQDTEFFGNLLRKGDHIMASFAAANMDPKKFYDPQKLDFDRKPNPHIEFGTGIHFCLGHQLARLELKTALDVLFARHNRLELVSEPQWSGRLGIRSLKDLQLRSLQ